jgi:hypothetical protein
MDICIVTGNELCIVIRIFPANPAYGSLFLCWNERKIMKRFMLCAMLLWAGIAGAQWDRLVHLTNDSFQHLRPQIIVDDSLHLHIFAVRSVFEHNPYQPTTLSHYLFDSWGNVLHAPISLSIDSCFENYTPGVLLDRDGYIHVVWGSTWENPYNAAMMYSRMSVSGEILTGPTIIPSDELYFYAQNGINLVQRQNGEIWIGADTHYAVLSATGDVITPFTAILQPAQRANQVILGATPNNQIWACLRYIDEDQSIRLLRLDTTGQQTEIVSTGWPQWIQMGPGAFYVDTMNTFHYILGRDDWGFFYQRDPRNGDSVTTYVFDSTPHGVGTTYFSLINRDTLLCLWEQPEGLFRVGYSLSGQNVIPPIVARPGIFEASVSYASQWRQGSLWVVGVTQSSGGAPTQLAMIHIPDANEPPNAIEKPSSRTAQVLPEIQVYPVPARTTLNIQLPVAATRGFHLELYNLLGQRIEYRDVRVMERNIVNLALPDNLPSGIYFVRVTVPSQAWTTHFIHLP